MPPENRHRDERGVTSTRRAFVTLSGVAGTVVFGFSSVTAQEEPDDEDREATLSVSDQSGDGETLVVEEACATVDYYVDVHYGDDQMVRTEEFEADTTQEQINIALDPPIEEDTVIEVGVHAAEDGAELASEVILYSVEDTVREQRGTLEVRDQTRDGETLLVWDVTANVNYYMVAHYDGETVQTGTFQAGLIAEQVLVDLDPPIEENTFVEVTLHAAGDDEQLAAEEICYRVK